jgi:predicted nucleic acid-binding Zn ribbon protein
MNKERTELKNEAVMHILVFILIFVVGSIIAACDGDYS